MTARPLDAAQDALIALQGQLIALLAARVGELEAANAELAARMDRLERAASRNSGNSSLPPLLRGALESGEADRLGLDRGFITAMPAAGRVIQRTRAPFTDEVARALADEASLQALARDHDSFDRGLRDAWETIIVPGRRCGEVLELRLDCLGRYGGLPMLWHDQTKVGNYGAAIRIPERVHQMLKARQRKTLDLFQERNNRPPTMAERALMALFPTNFRNRDCQHALSYNWFHKGFKNWIDGLDIGRQVPHQARHSLATSQLSERRGQPHPHPPLPGSCLRENGGALRPPCPV